MTADTILHRLHKNGRNRPSDPAYYEKDKATGQWNLTTWGEYLAQVRQAARALIATGFHPGDKVTILGFNRSEWVIFDLAAMLAGGAPAGIYTTNSPAEVKYIVEHAEAKLILLEDAGQWEKVAQVRDQLPDLKYVVMMRGVPKIEAPDVLTWEEFLAHGNQVPESQVDTRLDELKMDQLATLIYTSGTTGPPKGVMLSHHNLSNTARLAVQLLTLSPGDSVLSYLPLSHIAEQMFTIHAAITAGYQVYYAEDGLKVADNLKEVTPTMVFGVPRVWERFYAGVTAKMSQATGAKAKIATWAQGVGREVWAVKNSGGEPHGLLAFKYKLASKLVFSKVKEALGLGKLRYAISGAAPIQAEILEFFSGLDISIMEVYGQSEGSGVSTANFPGHVKYGSVGRPWPETDVKLGEDGEIIVRGPGIFLGYYKEPNATAKDLVDGWLHSGDLGEFDADGYLKIIGRKKEIIITSGGKNIAPKNIEAALKDIEIVADAIVIGDNRRFITALLTLEPTALSVLASQKGWLLDSPDLHEHPSLLAYMQEQIDSKVNTQFARVEQVRGFHILPQGFSVEGGELTPTLKMKRNVIYKKYMDVIEGMYTE
jgi:long-chain acyl-CoA synthetase